MNQHPFFWSSLQQSELPVNFINITPSALTFTYESGLTDVLYISGTTGYTISIISGGDWLSINTFSGSGETNVTGQTLTINSGVTNKTGTIRIQSLDLTIIKNIIITQLFEPQPLLFVYTEGGSFVGEIT